MLAFLRSKTHLAAWITFAAVALALMADLLIDGGRLGVNVLILQALFLIVVRLTASRAEVAWKTPMTVLASIAVVFSAAFALWESDLVLVVAAWGMILSNAGLLLALRGHHLNFRHPIQWFQAGLVHLLGEGLDGFEILRQAKSEIPHARTHAHVRSVAIGALVAIPILLIFIGLFASADELFSKWLIETLNFSEWISRAFSHFFLLLINTAVALFLLSAFWNRKTIESKAQAQAKFGVQSGTVLTLVVALFAIFLFFQAKYLFGGEEIFRTLDLSYASYARKGFAELIVCSILVLLLILSLRFYHQEKLSKYLTLIYAVLITETGLVLVSALMRLKLYVDSYGFTDNRLFAAWTLFTFGILLGYLLINLVASWKQEEFMRHGYAFILGSYAIFCLIGPAYWAAKWNLEWSMKEGGRKADVLSYQFAEEWMAFQALAQNKPNPENSFGETQEQACAKIATNGLSPVLVASYGAMKPVLREYAYGLKNMRENNLAFAYNYSRWNAIRQSKINSPSDGYQTTPELRSASPDYKNDPIYRGFPELFFTIDDCGIAQ